MIDGYDPRRGFSHFAGSKVAGHRGYFLKNDAVKLNLAIQQYAINMLSENGYTPIQTPYFMNKQIMQETC